ncbi:MAG: response regulator transcription factor [Rhodothermales bacterium]
MPPQTTRDIYSRRIKVMVVDDHPAIREALAYTIRDKMDMELVGQASSAGEAFGMMDENHPDVAIVDISLSDAHGLDVVQNIRSQYPSVQVLIYSMYDELAYAERAIHAGALGYLAKSEPTKHIVEAIRSVMRGEVYLSRRMTSRILGKVVKEQHNGFIVGKLTDREMSIFEMLGNGAGLGEISERLNLSRKTVETYRRRIKEKLGLDSVAGLMQYAIQWMHGQRQMQ